MSDWTELKITSCHTGKCMQDEEKYVKSFQPYGVFSPVDESTNT